MGGVGSGINALEHPPPSALPFQHHDISLATEFHQMEVVSGVVSENGKNSTLRRATAFT